MVRCTLMLLTVLTLTAGCGVAGEAERNELEQSRPATLMAEENPAMDGPASFVFEPPALASDSEVGFPRWYCPKSVVTRAQVASFIARTVMGPQGPFPSYDGQFTDVTAANPHADAIAFVAQTGISEGCADTAFCPDHGVTRGQMALFAVRMMHGADYLLDPPASARYSDVPPSHLHAAAIEQLALDGIELGCGAGTFCPDAPVTRDEVAAFLVQAKYRNGAPGSAPAVFADVAASNPYREAIGVIARDGGTFGCDAPTVGFRLAGEPLTERQRDWILYFAANTLPRLTAAYGDAARAYTAGSRVIWWSLKEGVFGTFDDPFRYSTCDGSYIGPFDKCTGTWEVGLAAAHVPGDGEVRQAAALLYPERETVDVAMRALEFGRALSATFDAGEYPDYATSWVMSDMALQRSWLTRDPTIGAYLAIAGIERDCIEGAAPHCFGIETEASRDFASDPQTARAVQADIRRILTALRAR